MHAEVVVRRSERSLGLSIRAGQERGDVRTQGEHDRAANQYGAVRADNSNSAMSPADIVTEVPWDPAQWSARRGKDSDAC